jgi:hypothetical protein
MEMDNVHSVIIYGSRSGNTERIATAIAFDTRLRLPRCLSGSAASGIGRKLRHAGARVVAPGESFFVTRAPALEEGEVERAAAWAASLAGRLRTEGCAR